MDQCAPRLSWLREDPLTRVSPKPFIKFDQDWFPYCGFCRRIGAESLVQCPSCSRFFKGPKRFFKIDYDCGDCG